MCGGLRAGPGRSRGPPRCVRGRRGGSSCEGAPGTMEAVNEAIPVTRAIDHGTAKLMPDVDRERAWLLTVDGAPQSYVDLDEPTHLEFEYARRLGHVLDTRGGAGAGAGRAAPRAGARSRCPGMWPPPGPAPGRTVVEADRGLLDLVVEQLPLPGGRGDRAARARTPGNGWRRPPRTRADVVVADVFGGSRVPAHLTSVEYARAAARVLRADGVYLANLADAAPFAFLRSQLATLRHGVRGAGADRRAGRCCAAGGSGTPCWSPRTSRSTSPPWPGGPPPTPSRPGSSTAPRCATSSAAPRPVRDEDAVPSPEPPDGAFGIG